MLPEKVLEYLNWKKQGLEKLKKIYPQNDEVYKYLENDIKHYNTEIEQFEGDKASSQRKLERIKKELDLKTRNLQSDYRAYDNFEAWYDLNKKNLERIKPYDPKRFEALEKELLLLDNENEAIKGKEISIKEEIIITKSYSITNKLLLYPFHENSYNKHRENLVSYYKLGSTEKHRNFDSKSYPTIREDKIGRRVMKLTSEEENLKEEYDQIQTKIINLFRREYGKQWLSPITNLFSVFSTKLGVQKTDHLAESRSEALSHSDDQHSPAMSPQITKNILSNEAPTNDQRNSFNPAIYSYAKQLLALEDQLIENRREYYTLKDYVVNKKIQGIETHEQTFKKFQTKKRNFDNNIKNVINEIIQNDEIRKKDIKEIPQRLESYQTAIAEAAQRLESYQTAIAEAAQRLKSYQTAIAEITQRQQWQERVGTFTSEETALSSKIQQLEQEKQQIEDIKTELEQKQQEMDVINGRIIQLHKNQELQKSSLQTAKDEMKILEEQHRRRLDLEGELATAKQELTQSREELERAKDALQEALDKEVRHLPTAPKIWTDEQIAHSQSQDTQREQVEAILLKSLSSDPVIASMAEAKIEAQTSYGYKLDNSIPREKREVSLAKIIRLKKEYEQRLEKEQNRLSEQNAAISVLEQLLKVPREQKSAEIETKKIELENLEKSIDRLEQRSFVSIEKSNAFSKSQTIVSSTYEKLLGSVNKTQKSNFEDPAESQSSEIISPELLNSLGQMHIQKQLMKDAREYNLSKHEKAEVQLEQRAKNKNNLIQNIEKLEKEYDELIGPLTNSQREKQQTLQEIDQIKSRIELFASVEHLHNAQINFSDKVIGEGTKASSHLDTAIHLTDQAGLCYAQGAYKWAELLLKQALQVREEHLGPNHPDTASSLYNLAGTYRAQGKYEQAEPLLNDALQIFGQLLQAQHPEQVGRKEDAQVTGHDEQAKPEQIDKLLSEVKKAIGNYKHLIKKVV